MRTGSPRDELAAALRRAHELATGLGAAPLLGRVEALARGARVSLQLVPRQPGRRPGDPAVGEGAVGGTAALPGLTPREREVLAHVVAGRTYGEIARALVISEKTVSVHISNLLRKTGAANRVDLAALVARLSSSRGH